MDWGGSEESLSEAGGHAAPDDVEKDEASDGLTSDEETQEDAATTGPAPPQTRWERLRDLAISQIQAARDENGLSQEAVNLVRSVPVEEPLPKAALSLRISCCVACFARGWQLRKALPANILLQRSHMGQSTHQLLHGSQRRAKHRKTQSVIPTLQKTPQIA